MGIVQKNTKEYRQGKSLDDYNLGKQREQERIIGLIQGLLEESENDAVEKPEYYEYVSIYQGLIRLISEPGKRGEGIK